MSAYDKWQNSIRVFTVNLIFTLTIISLIIALTLADRFEILRGLLLLILYPSAFIFGLFCFIFGFGLIGKHRAYVIEAITNFLNKDYSLEEIKEEVKCSERRLKRIIANLDLSTKTKIKSFTVEK